MIWWFEKDTVEGEHDLQGTAHDPKQPLQTTDYLPGNLTVTVGNLRIEKVSKEQGPQVAYGIFIDGKEIDYVKKITLTIEPDKHLTVSVEAFV